MTKTAVGMPDLDAPLHVWQEWRLDMAALYLGVGDADSALWWLNHYAESRRLSDERHLKLDERATHLRILLEMGV